MSDETDAKKILTASHFENWRRPPGRPRTTWMSNRRGSESSTLETDVYVWCYALLVVRARYEDDDDSDWADGTLKWEYRLQSLNHQW